MAQTAANACQWFGAAMKTAATDLSSRNHAQILDRLWFGTFPRDQVGGDFSGAIAIRVANVGDLAIGQPCQFARVLFAANTAPDDGHGDFVVGAHGAWFRSGDRS